MVTLRLLASSLGTTPGALVDGIGPIHYKGHILSRRSLEKIAQAAVGRKLVHLTSAQKTISCILSGIIKNKLNACNAVYKNTLKGSQTYVGNWLALKAAIGREASNDLLARVYNYIWLGEKQ